MKKEQKVEQKPRPAFIKVSEIDEGGIIRAIEYGYGVYVDEKPTEDGYYNYFIPAFNVHFFAKNEEDAERIEYSVMTSFFNYWVKNQGKKAFFDEIKRLGFVEARPTIAPKKNIRFDKKKPNVPPAFNIERRFSKKKMTPVLEAA